VYALYTLTHKEYTHMGDTLSIRVPTEVKASLEKLAASTGRSKSYLALDALKAYLAEQSWQIAETEQAVKEADAGDFAEPAEVEKLLAKWQ
jgi:RHH-type transcriptional regulator, rel operon repressor / antitoxin RelB